MDSAYKLKKEYSASGVPVFIADEEMNILWRNDADSPALELGENAGVIFDGDIPVAGLVSKSIDGEIFTFNVIKTEDGANGKSYYIIELISAGGVASAGEFRAYIRYICSKIRAAAGNITSVTDKLFEDISAGNFNAGLTAEGFDRIYESVMMLEREVFYPDSIYSLIDTERPDDIIILDKEMTAVAAGIKISLQDRLGSKVRISEDYDRDIFFHMNTDSFETAVASMAAECCGEGNYPERIIFSARRSGRNRAEITLMSLNFGSAGKAKDSPNSKSHDREDARRFNRRLLAEYIYDVLGLKNGARFSKENIPGGAVYKMNIEALPRGAAVFVEKPVDGSDRMRCIMDKLAFFFGDIPEAEKYRYTSRAVTGTAK